VREMEVLVGQLLGLVGIFLLVAVFQVDDRRKMLQLQIVSCLVWAAYYFMVDAYTASGLIFLGAIRCYVFDRYRNREWMLGVAITAYAIATLITWENWTSIMALMGMTLATIALWQKQPKHIRLVSLMVAPFWLTYNILNGSYMGVAGDLLTFSSVALGTVRFDILPQISRRRRQKTEPITESGVV
jgi:hypothetical protein